MTIAAVPAESQVAFGSVVWRHRDITAALAITTAALLLRLVDLGGKSLWMDEALTISVAQLSLPQLWLTPADPTPPLYYTIAKFVLLFGDSEAILRLPSVVFGSLSVLVTYVLARRIGGTFAAIAAAAFLCTSAVHVQYSQEARAYSLLFLLISLSALGFVRLLEAGDGRAQAGERGISAIFIAAVPAVLALYTHYTAVFWIAAADLVLLAGWRIKGPLSREQIRRFVLLNATIGILWLPGAWVFYQNVQSGTFGWLSQKSLTSAAEVVHRIISFTFLWKLQPYANLFVLGMVLTGVFVAFRRGTVASAPILSTLVIGPALVWAAGFLEPIFMLRTVLWAALGGALAIGVALEAIPRRSLAAPVLAMLLGGNLLSTANYFSDHEKEDWRGAAAYISKHIGLSDTLVVCSPMASAALEYYLVEEKSPRDLLLLTDDRRFIRVLSSGRGEDRQDVLGETFKIATREQANRLAPEESARVDRQYYFARNFTAPENGGVWLVDTHCQAGRRESVLRGVGRNEQDLVRAWQGTEVAIHKIAS